MTAEATTESTATSGVHATVLKRIQNPEAVVGLVGMGYVGLPLAVDKNRAGFHVIRMDHNPEHIARIQRKENYPLDLDDMARYNVPGPCIENYEILNLQNGTPHSLAELITEKYTCSVLKSILDQCNKPLQLLLGTFRHATARLDRTAASAPHAVHAA